MAMRSIGFSMIEMLVVVAIVAILALMAAPSFQDQIIRDQINAALPLADIAKTPNAASWALLQTFPPDNASAVLPPADKIVNNAISAVAVEDGSIHITFGNRAIIVALAAEYRTVDIASFREFVDAGGVLSYGASVTERLRMQARYAAKMIRGVKPADLPIEQAMRFEFVVNLKAAQALGVTIPKEILLGADDVIR